ncbi:PIG-P-domain-containing protein [Absidia repens]|uniref:PIG-P-domain-containing protein n=1 Tax=Absidia repens TaxID=90262 RepID=A0A1X2IB03_9FUNG|nr:PIG-P-domain-containing protein [Absidia repens]
MSDKDDSHKSKHTIYSKRLPMIATTLDQVSEEEDEDYVLDRRFRSSPLGTSQSAISLSSLARESYTGTRAQASPTLQQSPLQLHQDQSSSILSDQTSSLSNSAAVPSAINTATNLTMATITTFASVNKSPILPWHSDQSELPKPVKGRRNSFSSFLSKKYAKTKLQQDQERILPIINNSSNNNNNSNKDRDTILGKYNNTRTTKEFQKGHRPRSFSEVPAIPAPVERAPPVAITNKTPIYEYYGFVMYLASYVVFGLYAIWAYVPDHILHGMGITYYPNRYWALAIPVWIMTLVWFTFIYYMTINLKNTPPFDSYDCITGNRDNTLIFLTLKLDLH